MTQTNEFVHYTLKQLQKYINASKVLRPKNK